ncbi:MAG: stage V sporulation protein AB [Christensenellales bacterium]|jgi:hypothetical protein
MIGALAYVFCGFSAMVVGVSLAAVINAIAVPVKMAYYSAYKSFTKWAPWICAAGAAIFSKAYLLPGLALSLPSAVGALVILCMGISLGMNAVSLAEMMDLFTGPLNFLRLSEFKWLAFSIAAGKAVFCAVQLYEGMKL